LENEENIAVISDDKNDKINAALAEKAPLISIPQISDCKTAKKDMHSQHT